MNKVYWIEKPSNSAINGKLAIVARPRGNEWLSDELGSLYAQGINVLVSFLETNEQNELGLASEDSLAQRTGIEYYNYPIPDRQVPDSLTATRTFIQEMTQLMNDGKSIGIHCRQSVGRSGFMAAAIMVEGGQAVDDAFTAIEKARGCAVPDTEEQRQWVARYAQLKEMAVAL